MAGLADYDAISMPQSTTTPMGGGLSDYDSISSLPKSDKNIPKTESFLQQAINNIGMSARSAAGPLALKYFPVSNEIITISPSSRSHDIAVEFNFNLAIVNEVIMNYSKSSNLITSNV
jgi:hypothetical protein